MSARRHSATAITARRWSGTDSRSRSLRRRRRRHSTWAGPSRKAATFPGRWTSTSEAPAVISSFCRTRSSRFSTSISRWPWPLSGSAIARRRSATSRRFSGARRITRSATPSWLRSRLSALQLRRVRKPGRGTMAKNKRRRAAVTPGSGGAQPSPQGSSATSGKAPAEPILTGRPALRLLLLAGLTVLCLAPFVGKAFHIDDPLFLWAAKQIQANPGNPYGFSVNWYGVAMPMSEVTKNPPLTSYYIAAVAAVAGWSERSLHLAFLLPAIVAILGTYLLAERMGRRPRLAGRCALCTLAL